jgi:hypothetical protein
VDPDELSEALTKAELLEVAEANEVPVAKSKTKVEIAEAIVDADVVSDDEEDARALLLAARESKSSKDEQPNPKPEHAGQPVPERVEERRFLEVDEETGAFGNTHSQSPVLDRAKRVDLVYPVAPPRVPEPDVTSPPAAPSYVRRYPIPGNPAKS